jgi:TPP-dependent pyruvate/acetoin dehydrogenase alpha subunit
MGPHSSSDDPTRYRDPKLCESWAKRDPIERFRHYLKRTRRWTQEFEQEVRTGCENEIEQAIQQAEKVAPPPVSSMFEDVFAERTPQLTEQWIALKDALQRGVVSKGHHGEFPL